MTNEGNAGFFTSRLTDFLDAPSYFLLAHQNLRLTTRNHSKFM